MTERGWAAVRTDDIPRMGERWIPIRRHFGIRGFGVNAWAGDEEGAEIIGEHVEDSGHEELYFVSAGRATFTVGGDEVDAPAGTLVFVDPQTRRKAVAREAGTTILSIGAKPGEAFEVMGWESTAEMWPLYEAGDYEGALAILRASLEHAPEPGTYYNIACIEAVQGHKEEAIEHLRKAVSEPRFLEAAADDSDLDSIRDDPRVVELLTPKS
jgi:mannose-6-phosphate isomerase-like protein (cupin superfamily)